MHYVDSKAGRFGHSGQRVHIGAIHINKPATVMNNATDFPNVSLELSNGVGIGKHESGDIFAHMLSQLFEIGKTVAPGGNSFNSIAADYCRSRVCAVSGIGSENFLSGG